MRLAVRLLAEFRGNLHARAYELNSRGRTESAQAVWAVVEELDVLLNRLNERRR